MHKIHFYEELNIFRANEVCTELSKSEKKNDGELRRLHFLLPFSCLDQKLHALLKVNGLHKCNRSVNKTQVLERF